MKHQDFGAWGQQNNIGKESNSFQLSQLLTLIIFFVMKQYCVHVNKILSKPYYENDGSTFFFFFLIFVSIYYIIYNSMKIK